MTIQELAGTVAAASFEDQAGALELGGGTIYEAKLPPHGLARPGALVHCLLTTSKTLAARRSGAVGGPG